MKKNKIIPQSNEQFSCIENTELECFDILFKKLEYTSQEVHSIAEFVFNMGRMTDDTVRFAHTMPKKKSVIITQ